jgi:phosphoglycolate phosphatase-like HAD superfamily hydrolase
MKYEKKTIIFDVDGTIADVEHRRHLVNGDKGFKPDWDAFRKATEDDTPVQWVCDIAKRYIAQGDEVAFFSARNESEREVTEKQINDWIGEGHKGVFLRPNDDYTPDDEFKSKLADKFIEMGGKIDLIFDDRQKVVDMWRAKGFTVVQVAKGDF